jgi:hypothetical protein
LAATYGWPIHQCDVVSAFLNGDLEEKVFLNFPEGFEVVLSAFPAENTIGYDPSRDQVLEVLKSLYGLKQSPRQWAKKLKEAFSSLGFTQLQSDNTLFIHYQRKLIICTYVDDFLITGPSFEEIKSLKKDLTTFFEITDLGEVSYFLGIRLVRNPSNKTITLMQDAFVHRLLEAKHMESCKPAKTPLAAGSQALALPNSGQATTAEINDYSSTVGTEMYLMTQTRPDLVHSISVVSRFSHNPSKGHKHLTDHQLRYLKGTVNDGLVLGGDHDFPQPQWDDSTFKIDGHTGKTLSVTVWADSDFKGDKATGKSTYSFFTQLGTGPGNVVGWKSKLMPRVALSTTEAEYYALGRGAQQILWLRGLFTELRIPATFTLKGDNQGSIKLTKNPEYHQRTGYIPLEEHFIRSEIEAGKFMVEWVPTENMVADGGTKILSPSEHQKIMRAIGVADVVGKGARFIHPI